jgi:hypothetical protein
MATSRVNFTEWLPDQPGVIGALTNAKNVYPKAVGYGPVEEEEDFSDSASQDLNSIAAAEDASGNTKLFAGGSTKLFLLSALDNSLDDVSGTTYAPTNRWNFAQFGSYMIAANGENKLQYYDITTASDFQDLSSDAPTAKYITVVRDFVVAGGGSSNDSRVQWSGINDPTTWSSSGVTQSDFQDIPDGGRVQNITGGEFGLVLMEKSIIRMSYVGTPLVFQFDNIAKNLGCFEPNSVVQWQGITYFLSDDGFYSCNGQQVEPIGAEKINRYFFKTVDQSQFNNMSTSVDPTKNLIAWGYPDQDGHYSILFYHLVTKRWSYAVTNVNRLGTLVTPSVTLENLDSISASLDALITSLDSSVYLGGKNFFGGVRGAKIITFSGPYKTAYIDTSDIEAGSNKSMITLAKPIVDGGSGSVAIATRQLLNETPTFGNVSAADSEGRVGVRSFGRYHRVRTVPSGEWVSAIGVELEIQQGGYR